MQIIGLCRFSYPCLGGFQTEHETIEDRINYLFDDTRLEERFRTFEHVTIPGIRYQTDTDFTFVIVTGTDLPDHHLHRLEAIVADIPHAKVLQLPPMQHRPAMREVIEHFRKKDGGPSVEFRLDDDDAVAIDFVEELRASATNLLPMFRAEGRLAIDFNQGLVMKISDKVEVGRVIKPCWTPALAVMLWAGAPRCLMDFAHHKLPHLMTTVTQPRRDMFIRGLSDFNDSSFDRRENLLEPASEETAVFLSERFGIDITAIPVTKTAETVD